MSQAQVLKGVQKETWTSWGWRAIWFWGVASYLVLGGGELFGFGGGGGGGELFGFGGWRAIWFWGVASYLVLGHWFFCYKNEDGELFAFWGGWRAIPVEQVASSSQKRPPPPPSEIKYLGKNIFMLRTQSGELFLEEPSTPRCGL